MAKILVISETLWYPPDTGDTIRQFHPLKYLKGVHDYTWCCRYRHIRSSSDEGSEFAKDESLRISTPNFLTKAAKAVANSIAGDLLTTLHTISGKCDVALEILLQTNDLTLCS